MNIKHLGSHIGNNTDVNQHHQHNLPTILIVVFGSFVLGAIPITYGLSLTPDKSQNAVMIPGEATLWKAVGES